ncbi:hypothetical protein G9P44_003893 [Scheffersomyces stipitis]|nr:hypothetical protein G9P44_003893 [Scheffersomyces stipitis]
MSGTVKNSGAKPKPSRKGKKAWRKNIDIQDVETALEENRENEIHVGKKSSKRGHEDEDEDDFVIDSTPSVSLQSRKVEKKLKTHEILTNKSKVEALSHPKGSKAETKNTIQGVKRTEVLRLMKLAGGKYKDESKIKNRIDKDGLIHVQNKDLWGTEEIEETPVSNFSSTTEFTQASVVPKTLKSAPIRVIENDLNKKLIDAGKSYNPSLESWKQLINKEYGLEHKRELTRQQMAEHREKIKELMNTLDVNESDSEDSENEQEEQQDEEDGDYQLSINKPTQVKIKTKTKRNREEKHKKREGLQQELKELKKQLRDLTNLDELLQKEDNSTNKKTSKKDKNVSNKPKKLFKYDAVQAPLEVKLSNELTNNLKNLKPEGNLFYDQMLNLQSTGKIETRIPVAKRRKYTPKITEKWTYKDFK